MPHKYNNTLAEPNPQANILSAMLTEYNSVRKESVSTINNRLLFSSCAFTAFSILLAGLSTRQSPDLLSGIIAMVFVPLLTKLCLLMWLGEYNRSQRAGRGMVKMEQKINDLLQHPSAVSWETDLQDTQAHMGYPYVSTILLMMLTGWVSFVLGMRLAYDDFLLGSRRGIDFFWPMVAMAIGDVSFWILLRQKWRRIRLGYRG